LFWIIRWFDWYRIWILDGQRNFSKVLKFSEDIDFSLYERALENHYHALNRITSIFQCSSIYYNRALYYYCEASELECVQGDRAKLTEIYNDISIAY
jgi:hypothetical protein